jgi:hypothetical protein
MKKLIVVLALAILLVPGIVLGQPGPGKEGDPAMRLGWGYLDGWSLYQSAGINYYDLFAGASVTTTVMPMVRRATDGPALCTLADTICFDVWDKLGWTIACDPPKRESGIMAVGYGWYQDVTITAPCEVSICDYDTVICGAFYWWNHKCDPAFGDCADPNTRNYAGPPPYTLTFWQLDTLIIHIIEAPPALGVHQDTLTLIDQGQTMAFVPFSICNQDPCAPVTTYGYNITSLGYVGDAINTTGSVSLDGGACKTVSGVINAGEAAVCAWDTLTIIAWTVVPPVVYDTCVQVIHVIEPVAVPLFTVPVVTILVLALILAAAVFMRRRAVSRA